MSTVSVTNWIQALSAGVFSRYRGPAWAEGEVMSDGGLGRDSWWDKPAYAASQDTFTKRGAFTVAMALHASECPHP